MSWPDTTEATMEQVEDIEQFVDTQEATHEQSMSPGDSHNTIYQSQ